MSTSSRTRSSGPVLPITNKFQRSVSPSGRFCSSSPSDSSALSAFASSTSGFSAPPSFFNRSASPTRVNLYATAPPSPSVRFSISRSTSPGRPISVSQQLIRNPPGRVESGHSFSAPKKTCMCSPTTHPGSFRCSLHKNSYGGGGHSHGLAYSSNRLNARRSAMTNSLVRIGSVEGEWVKRALTALIRPSSHQQRRRSAFQPRPSRLSVMSKARDV
ncbi:uncharacterized protein LOC131152007 [Malania oleifera]|uniref:uncharacterized protein LOC131152007 n=1 Tax=Malania oleifera TaxID=397392 RepID=UPI0025AEA0CA|nr:uncharacterized protein LOC131152007 [Malania oleifera]